MSKISDKKIQPPLIDHKHNLLKLTNFLFITIGINATIERPPNQARAASKNRQK